jgi:hypothetical protein
VVSWQVETIFFCVHFPALFRTFWREASVVS